MRRDTKTSQAADIFDDATRIASERVRGSVETDRGIVPTGGADLDAIDHEHPVVVRRRCDTGRVAVIGEDYEVEARRGGSGRNLRHGTAPVRATAVDVVRPAHRVVESTGENTRPVRLRVGRRGQINDPRRRR